MFKMSSILFQASVYSCLKELFYISEQRKWNCFKHIGYSLLHVLLSCCTFGINKIFHIPPLKKVEFRSSFEIGPLLQTKHFHECDLTTICREKEAGVPFCCNHICVCIFGSKLKSNPGRWLVEKSKYIWPVSWPLKK